MGIYYLIVNDSKKEYINPHDMGGGAKSVEIMLPSKASIATAILLSDQYYTNCSRAGTWENANLVDDTYDEDRYYYICDNYTNVSTEVLSFIKQNNITEEDWMEDVLRDNFSHDAWGEYDSIKEKYQISGKKYHIEALKKIGELTVNIDKIPDLNDPNITQEEVEKAITPTVMAEKPIVFEIAMGRPDLTEEDKKYYMKIRKKLMQSIDKFGDSIDTKDLEKLIELSEHMTYALYGFNGEDTILEALKKYEKQIQYIVSK